MSERLDALKKLERVAKTGTNQWAAVTVYRGFGAHHQDLFGKAKNGSLDAAKALHEAVLPEWRYQLDNRFHDDGCTLVGPDEGKARGRTYATVKDNPARAWLLCIIRALIAIEEQGT